MKGLKFFVCLIVIICMLTACAPKAPAAPSPVPMAVTPQPTAAPQSTAFAPTPAVTPDNSPTPAATPEGEDIAQSTKKFLLNGQNDLPEAGKLHWTEDFLNLVDMQSLYEAYIAKGGKSGDIKSFAQYITDNAPVPDTWKELFEAAFQRDYGEKIVKYELIEEPVYQVYVEIEGNEVPYVALNTRTGYYHG